MTIVWSADGRMRRNRRPTSRRLARDASLLQSKTFNSIELSSSEYKAKAPSPEKFMGSSELEEYKIESIEFSSEDSEATAHFSYDSDM
jgi:hypothetical protein